MDIQTNQSKGVFPRFFMKAVQSKVRSEEAGRPIFGEKEYVEIRIAGDSKTVVCRKVGEEDKRRWPEQYQAFLAGQNQPTDGTPIEHWPAVTVSQVEELKALNVRTVEALAELQDVGIERLGMGGRTLVAKAKAFISSASGSAEVEKLAAENVRLKDDIDMLRGQIRELSERMGTPKSGGQVGQNPSPVTEDEPRPSTASIESGPIEALNLSPRTVTALQKAEITTIEGLLALTSTQLSEIPGVGVTALDEISRAFEVS